MFLHLSFTCDSQDVYLSYLRDLNTKKKHNFVALPPLFVRKAKYVPTKQSELAKAR
jgi:hypothetical protein